jgi:hypothetical protein
VKLQNGRDHNSYGFSLLLVGGGIKEASPTERPNDFGFRAVAQPVQVYDLHATILDLLGFDYTPYLTVQRAISV